MTYMLEVYYQAPPDPKKEAALLERVCQLGGRLDYREEPREGAGVVLTYEFDRPEQADAAAESLRRQGEYVEGPQDYGT